MNKQELELDFEIDEVESVEFLNNDYQDVYDIGMVDTPHTFFANDILVHNSIYCDFGEIIKCSENLDNYTKEEQYKTIKNDIEVFFAAYLEVVMKDLSHKEFNCNTNLMNFDRENIADRGFMVGKKRYILHVVNNENHQEIDYPKIVGIEIIRSSTSNVARKSLKNILLELIDTLDTNLFISRIKAIREEYMTVAIEDICNTSTANNLGKYTQKNLTTGDYKSFPVHVKGAVLFNKYIDNHTHLKLKHDKIYEGDKIKWCYMNETKDWNTPVMSYKDKIPKEMIKHVDREIMFEKGIIGPLKKFFKIMKLNVPNFKMCEVDDLFEW